MLVVLAIAALAVVAVAIATAILLLRRHFRQDAPKQDFFALGRDVHLNNALDDYHERSTVSSTED